MPNLNDALRKLAKSLRSIKARITLSAVAALVAGIGLTTVLLVHEAETDTLAARHDSELRESVRTAGILSRRVVALQRALAATAAMLDERTLHDAALLREFVASKPVLRGMFATVFVAQRDGQMLIYADEQGLRNPTLSIADRDYFKRSIAERRPIVSEPLSGRMSNEPVIVFTYPLQNAGGTYGLIAGALRLRSRDLLSDLVEEVDSSAETRVLISDAKGQILAHPDRERVMQSISTEPRMAAGFVDWLGAGGASGGAVEPSGLFLRQAGQVLTVAGVPGLDWLVWRAVPESDLLAPLHAARRKALSWASLIVVCASLGVLAVIGWLLRPLSLLKARAAHLFDGHDDVQAGWPRASGEIGELSRVLRHVGAERAQLERFNAQVLARLGSVMAAAPLGILFTRAQRFELVSAEMCRLVGRAEEELLGQPVRLIFASNEDYEALGAQAAAAFAAGGSYVGEWLFVRAGSEPFWGRLRGQQVENGNADTGTIWTLADVSDQVAARAMLEWSATHDALTGLPNRKMLEQSALALLEGRPGALPAAMVMIDLDRFKPINDSAGHAAGDAMLKLVAAAIGSKVRATDMAARVGGDEFALLLRHCPIEVALRIAGQVREAVSGAVLSWNGRQLTVGASLGVAPLTAGTDSVAAWLHQADAACYQAKASGRGAVRAAAGHEQHAADASFCE